MSNTPASPVSNTSLLFLHIPKTGGQTVAAVLEKAFGVDRVYRPGRAGAKPVRELTAAEHARIAVYSGHLSYGTHEFVPGTYAYCTLLREPVQRLVSFWYFARRFPDSSGAAGRIARSRQTLHEWLSDPEDRAVLNAQAAQLAGADLATFAAVGVTERTERFLSVLGDRMGFAGWGRVDRQNAGVNRPPVGEIPLRVYERAMENNALDWELYRKAFELA